MAIKVLLVSKHILLRQGLSCLLKEEKDLKLVGEATTGEEARERVGESLPDLVLIDIALMEGDTPEVLEWLKRTYPQIKMVAISFQDYPEYVFSILQAGASGVLLGSFHYEEVVKAIRQVVSGQVYLNQAATKIFVEKFQELPHKVSLTPVLSQREREVLKLIAQGKNNLQAAEQLNLSPKTIDAHRRNIMKKLRIYTRAELGKYALQIGLVT